jgi:beta-glucosidase
VKARTTRAAEHTWHGEFDPGVDPARFSARLRGRFVPAESGLHTFALTSAGRARLFVEGQLAVDNWTSPKRGDSWYGLGSTEESARLPLEAGRACELVLEYTKQGAIAMGGVKLGHLPPLPEDLFERAVAAAADADAAVVVVGLGEEWETEGHDKADWTLPGRQAELVEKVAAANPRTVVVLNAAAPVAMEWAPAVPAILHAWYGGQEAGHAVADVLFGDADPGGRLPTTIPERLADHPAHTGDPAVYPGRDGRVVYAEDLLLGYRHFDAKEIAPRFPFGHGLSYARFAYGPLALSAQRLRAGEALEVRIAVRNTGDVRGTEVVQLYVHDEQASLPRPPQELRAFAKVELAPGEERTVSLALGPRAFAFWHPGRRAWHVEPGAFELRAGRSSRDVRSRARVIVEGEA